VVAAGATTELIGLDGDPLSGLALLGPGGRHLKAVVKRGCFAVDRLT